jgi:hypothetical protein
MKPTYERGKKMAKQAKKVQLQGHRVTEPEIRFTGRGAIGATGKPPGFKVIKHPPEPEDEPIGSGRVGTCGIVYR